MKRIFIFAGIIIVLTAVALAACSVIPGGGGNPFSFPTSTPRPPIVEVTSIPTAEGAARAFLDAWKIQDYKKMYSLLSTLSRDAMTQEKFQAYYQDVQDKATLSSLDYRILSVQVTPTDAEVSFEVTLRTALVGDITRSPRMLLKYQDGGWKVAWDDATVLPELKGGNSLMMFFVSTARGNIYDRNGLALASEAEAISIGIVSGEITDENRLVVILGQLLRIPAEKIRQKIDYDHPDWYIPIGDVNKEDIKERYGELSSLGGVRLSTAKVRYYYGGGVASHVIGYTQQPSKEMQAHYKSLGYQGDEKVGVTGLEMWGEQFLAGRQGGTLFVISPTGNTLATLAKSDPVPSSSIYTTLDRDLQARMEQTLMGPFSGSAVVLKRDTGEVLAMMSSPTFDSNLFDPANFNNQYIQSLILDNPRQPLLNRAAEGLYPLGSVFKIITMSAGLESGDFTPNSVYECNGYFNELPGFIGTDWTIERDMKPHGKITLVQGLMRSCNPYFWHVGLDLYYKDAWLVPNMAHGFGLGKETGIGVIPEEAGQVPDPAWKRENSGEDWTGGDALNQAIGQGSLQVTPLQVVDFAAAVGNGGTLYRPQLILSIKPPIGDPIFTFTPEIRGMLPVKPENLAAVQEGMRGVVNDPKGTARYRFYEISNAIKIAGKTGTASSGTNYPHAWFVSYTANNTPGKPDIATVVIVENIGEGSTYAAPMTRRILEIYFYGRPAAIYPWESTYGMRGTDTPEVTEEPTVTISP